MQAKCIKQVTSGTSEAIRSMVQLAMSEGFEGHRFLSLGSTRQLALESLTPF